MTATASQTSLAALELAQGGRFAELREMFAPPLKALLAPETLEAGWNEELDRQGPIVSVGEPLCETQPGASSVVKVAVLCERGGFTLVAAVTEAGQLAGLQHAPVSAAQRTAPWKAPGYVDPASFAERELTLGSGPLAVGATASIPRRPGPLPGVVLLAGSGPLDRDETIGANKPLKDIAWGLASSGVAAVRFDKVTHAHPREIKADEGFTLADEYLPHALAAVAAPRREPGVGPGRVFLLGHSLGGTVAPRVAAAEPSVAGIIVLAGGTEPLHWVIVRQVRYLASLRPRTEAASQPVIERLSEQARMVDSPDLSPATRSSELPLGAPAAYWLDLRDYDPVEVAARLDKPMLILQGGRDYQVTVADDLARWQARLAAGPNVTIRVYPPHNHLFTPGSGPSSPEEYEPAQHVDGQVIGDIASWIEAQER